MSNIDKQALREAAERATPGDWKYSTFDCAITDDTSSLAIVRMDSGHLNDEQSALNGAFIAAANPVTVLALLDELEAKDAQIANLTAERDALREGEMGDAKHSNTRAAADIYFQLVEECGIPAGGSLVEYISDLRETAAAGKGE